MTNPYLEIGTDDRQVSTDFFAAVFAWEWEGNGESGTFRTPNGPIGLHGGDVSMIVPYFQVASVQSAVDRVREQGGTVIGEIRRDDGFGASAICLDPRGVRFGLHRPE